MRTANKTVFKRRVTRNKVISTREVVLAQGPLGSPSQWSIFEEMVESGTHVRLRVPNLGTVDCANFDAAWAESRIGDELVPEGWKRGDVYCTGGFGQGGEGIVEATVIDNEVRAGVGVVIPAGYVAVITIVSVIGGIMAIVLSLTDSWADLTKFFEAITRILMWTALGVVGVASAFALSSFVRTRRAIGGT